MRAKLEYNLPEEQEDFRRAVDGHKAFIVISDLDNWLRDKVKYSESTTEVEKIVFDMVRSELNDLMQGEHLPYE